MLIKRFARYIGETNFAPGEWAGVELDQPLGESTEGSKPLLLVWKRFTIFKSTQHPRFHPCFFVLLSPLFFISKYLYVGTCIVYLILNYLYEFQAIIFFKVKTTGVWGRIDISPVRRTMGSSLGNKCSYRSMEVKL